MGFPFKISSLFLLCLLILFSGFESISQSNHHVNNIRFEHITEGLSQSTVTCILQDKKGFMWFGTRNGLNRYDGVDFKVFERNLKDSTSLSHSYVTAIFEDSRGNLWVGTKEGGLNLYNADNETFTHYVHDKNNSSSLSHNNINCIYEDINKRLWVGTEYGLNRLLETKKEYVSYKYEKGNPESLCDNNISVIFEDSRSNLWVGTKGGGLELFDQKRARFKHHRNDPKNTKTISNNVIRACLKDSRGRIWLGTENGLNLFVEKKEGIEFVRYQHHQDDPNSLTNSAILSLSEDAHGRIWIGTQISGLSIFDKDQNLFLNVYPNPLNAYSISSNSLWSIYRDKTGIMWIGARNRGIDKWDENKQKFNHYNIPYSSNSVLSKRDVTCFQEDEAGNLWIGTDGGGLIYYDRKNNRYTSYVYNPSNPKSLGSNAVVSLLIDSKKRVWVGTWGGGLNLFDKSSGTFKHYIYNPADSTSLHGNNIMTMCEDSHGQFWVGVFSGGLNLYDPETDSFRHYTYNPHKKSSISSNRITKIFEDSQKQLWIGTDGAGLDLLNWVSKDDVSFTHYKYEHGFNNGGLSSNIINAIIEDKDNNLWIGTGQGLNKINYKNQTFRVYGKEDGLPDNVVNGLIEDKNGYIWLSTNQGISKLNPVTGETQNYTTADGLQSQEFIRGSYLKSRTGELFFGGINGFNSFFPDNIKSLAFFMPLYLTEFRIRNELVLPGQEKSPLQKHISETKEMTIPYADNDFGFSFAVLNYSNAVKREYAYKLEGYDKDWQFAGTQRNANYSKVPPGNYIFRVKSTENGRVYNNDEVRLSIVVLPPWWQTWWAYTFYLIVFLSALWWYRQLLIRRLHLENDLKMRQLELMKMQEMEHVKSNFFANISHEFRTPLTLILSPLRDMFEGSFHGDFKRQYQIMIRSAERLLKLINQLLDLSKLDAGHLKLEPMYMDLIQFLRPIFSSFEMHANRKNIEYKLVCDDEKLIFYADPDKMEKIITNLLSNAFKFTHSGSITLSACQVDDDIQICVSDTGKGIASENIGNVFDHFYQVGEDGSGIGLALAKELTELHKGNICLESEEGVGTSVYVRLPVGPKQALDVELMGLASSENSIEKRLEMNEVLNKDEVHSRQGTPLLLIVEDDHDMRKYLKERLQRNYRIIEAENGVEGLKMGAFRIPDLIISDVFMPKMNGMEMCRQLKREVKTSHIPVILLTALADMKNKIEGLETGADDYVSKPFDSNELEVRIKNLIESRKRIIERFNQNNNLVLEPKEITITPLDEIFIRKVIESIEANISDPEFRVEDLGKEVGMSRMPLYKKIKALTGQTAVEFIRTIRLKRAAQLLKQQELTVSEITYDVGFNDLQYFRTCFKKKFGLSPSEYAKLGMDIATYAGADM